VGRYGVDVAGFEAFIQEIDFFTPANNWIVIDEIGKMECFSEKFVRLLTRLLDSERRLLATIALKGTGPIARIKRRGDVRLMTLTAENQGRILDDILQQVMNTYSLHPEPISG
jgi:nucleoside-triphosphatase